MSTEPDSPAEPFGRMPDGTEAHLYALQNDQLSVRITDYGGRLVSVEAPDRDGRRDHVVLGFASAPEYATIGGSFGALLGRTANRIAGGRFTLDGQTYQLVRNEGENTLHGGRLGFNRVFWQVAEAAHDRLTLAYLSPDGDQGFPGELAVRATYRLEGDSLSLSFAAETTKPTPLNLSTHPYFNLAGAAAVHALDHEVTIAADRFLPTDQHQIPTGEIRPVEGTPFDFRRPVAVGARIRQPDPQLMIAKGYDHFYVRDAGAAGAGPDLIARASHAGSGRVLEVFSDHPGAQFYTGNNLNGSAAGRGGAYRQSAGIAFEPQSFPDAPNQPGFPNTILRPGTVYRREIRFRFTTDRAG
ncbi:MAG: galactose mutarotase [Alphaproteobacteria bacterium]|nr:galactose mutarotase [Alphaproteobacteria bacterium]